MKCKKWFSSPFIEERLYFSESQEIEIKKMGFSSPFIEERLYLELEMEIEEMYRIVLVPFYRGAVVFIMVSDSTLAVIMGSRPLLSRSGCIFFFIFYIHYSRKSSRPLLSRSGCIWYFKKNG